MAGLSASAAQTRAGLFAELAAAKNEADAREIEERLWTFWRSFGDGETQRLLEESRLAQLRFDYGNALVALEKLVKHQPRLPKAGTSSPMCCSWPAAMTLRSKRWRARWSWSRCITRRSPAKESF